MVAHPGCRDTPDLGGQVGPYGERALRDGIDEAHRVAHSARLEPRGQLVGEFGERRIDLLIAIEPRHPEHARLQPRRRIGGGRKTVVKPLGK